MKFYYTHVFNIGPNYHRVELFESYSEEKGVHDPTGQLFEEFRATDIVKKVKEFLTKEQMVVLKSLMKYKQDGIGDEEGKYFNY